MVLNRPVRVDLTKARAAWLSRSFFRAAPPGRDSRMGHGAGHRGAAPPLDRMGCGLAAGARRGAQHARAQGAADGAIGTADAVTAPGCESGARQQSAAVECNSCHAVGNDVGKTDCRGWPMYVTPAARSPGIRSIVDFCVAGKGDGTPLLLPVSHLGGGRMNRSSLPSFL